MSTTSEPDRLLRPALTLFVALSLITGLLYPLAVTGVSQWAFPDAAQGSLIRQGGKVVGSSLIGQPFSDASHFWSRPSATGPMSHNAAGSGGSNLGTLNPALTDAIKARVQALRAADPGNTRPVPIDLVTASASGLDPHISRAAADYQLPRIVRVTGLPEAQVRQLIDQHSQSMWLGFLGEARVNVLALNMALDTQVSARAVGGGH
jgi:K+-transporting ATPase ATPase C chain